MPFVIGSPCIDVTDRSCIEECPVDCIYEGDRKLYINPVECIDCGACESVCPVSAIAPDHLTPYPEYLEDNARFFAERLPGKEKPLGNPGGAIDLGRVGVDTPLVAGQSFNLEK